MVTNIGFEVILPSIKSYLFHQCVVDFLNKPELNDQNYQNNVNVKDDNYNGKFLFPLKNFLSFGTEIQSMYFMSIIFLNTILMDYVFYDLNLIILKK